MADESADSVVSSKVVSSEQANEAQPTATQASKASENANANANANATAMDEETHKSREANAGEPTEAPAPNINGGAPVTTAGIASPPAEPDVPQSDTTDSKILTATADPIPATPNARGKKSTNGSAKKRSSGVPEHRSRKQGKKKSKPAVHLDGKPGELFLARMKGHQPWPSIICDEDMLPAVLLNSRPTTAAQADGSFKKPDYAPGGKREQDRTFPLMFLRTNEFAWIPATGLTPITPEECGAAADKQKSKTLAEAYKVAEEGHDLAHFKQVLSEHQEMLNAEEEAKAEREAKKAEKVTKQKRKSDAIVASAEDKMDVDNEQPSKSQAKKRKKEATAEDSEKPSKAAKTGTTKLKLNMTPKTVGTDAKKKTPKAKSSTKKSVTKPSGSDEEETAKIQEEVLTPAQLREKKEKEVRYIRHKLQKGFLSRDNPPGDDEIETMSNYLSKVEAHPNLESGILRATKIHKVLKGMIRLDSIPKDEQYQFKRRSRDLLDKWNKILASDTVGLPENEDESKIDGGHQQEVGGEATAKNTTDVKSGNDVPVGKDNLTADADTSGAENKDVSHGASATTPLGPSAQANGGTKADVGGADSPVEVPKDVSGSITAQA